MESDTSSLREELEQFREEQDKIRAIVGQIGGARAARKDRVITRVSIIIILMLFLLDVLRHMLGLTIPLPPLFSVELAVFLVSMKIIWMMHRQAKVEHFQFWILNSIEFRLNDVAARIRNIEKQTAGKSTSRAAD